MTASAQTRANRRAGGRKAALAAKAARARAAEAARALYGPEGTHRGTQADRVATIGDVLARLRADDARTCRGGR